ncbi:YtxH domain-containing protein [Enterococcus sp. LJL98]
MGFFKGLLFGSTLGGIGGLLFAPRKGAETLEKWSEPIEIIREDSQTLQKDYQAVKQNLAKTQALSTTLLPQFQKELEKEIDAFKFQSAPRITRINEQLNVLQQHLAASPLNKAKE